MELVGVGGRKGKRRGWVGRGKLGGGKKRKRDYDEKVN